MKIGLQIPWFGWEGGPGKIGENLHRIGEAADAAGFASIWVMDHLFQIRGVGKVDDPMFEGYTTLGFLAASTKRARLGTMVTAVTYRHPGLLIKEVTTLDVLSGGRAWLGIGAGWFEREALGLGVPFPHLQERYERLEETLHIARRMWSGDSSPFKGKHFDLREPLNQPPPLSKPHPPILIGGGGERKTLRLVAQYADACNFFTGAGNQVLAHKLDVLKRHCDALGRDYGEIEKTVLVPAGAGEGRLDMGRLIADCRAWSRMGIQHVILSNVPGLERITPLESVGKEIIPAAASL